MPALLIVVEAKCRGCMASGYSMYKTQRCAECGGGHECGRTPGWRTESHIRQELRKNCPHPVQAAESRLFFTTMSAPQKVSFTVRRPTPISRGESSGPESDSGSSFKVPSLPRHLSSQNDSVPGSPLARSATSSPRPKDKPVAYYDDKDSSDEDNDGIQDELVTGFNRFGVQRCVARGGNDRGQNGGGQETEDQRALRAILAGVNGNNNGEPSIDIIPTPVSEEDALKQDVADLPDSATLTDYERVPVSQFGAALLRGMGWKEGTAASKKGKGMVEPYLPEARPALLGIGAKEKEALDDGRPKKGGSKRPEKRYMPVVRKEREGSRRDADADGYRNGAKDRSDSQRGAAPGGIRGRLEDAQRGETPTIVQLTSSDAAVVTEPMIGIATATTGGLTGQRSPKRPLIRLK
ncbi:DExH-box splicing factor binding site-domain-containing protein [Salix suchowensis]|nr:DExH-box splicing factor binding site-domain-containing protein [Salix suchowensis]